MESEQDLNPYTSPTAEEQPEVPPYQDLKDDRLLVTPLKCTLPPRCVYCNQPATRSAPVSGYWFFTPSGIRGVKVASFLCEDHKQVLDRQDRPLLYLMWIVLAGYVIAHLCQYLIPGRLTWFDALPSSFVSVIVWPVVMYQQFIRNKLPWRLKSLAVAKANSSGAYLKHAGRPFLDSLADGAEGFRVVDKVPP